MGKREAERRELKCRRKGIGEVKSRGIKRINKRQGGRGSVQGLR